MTAKAKSPTYRYSIIPARAVTDPNITAQALRVLALLGRHTDENGWCRRSQVKMASELSCGRATVQRGLDELVAAGYVEKAARNPHRLRRPG
jgi:DNA-binding MarR family transcriptional regulator